MTIRIAAIEVSHWHALNDAAYLRHLAAIAHDLLDRGCQFLMENPMGLNVEEVKAVGDQRGPAQRVFSRSARQT